jgi:phospholipid/cholesterol/gamma-HCH transport system substrate-binding protein
MSAPTPSGGAALVRLRLAGVAFIVVIALLIALTVLLYRKAFTPVAHVFLETDRIGNQLSAPADVKVKGVLVGEVRSIRSSGDGAVIDMAMQPGKLKDLPANVTAQLLPKTLFGEKYVLLQLPEQPATERLEDGSRITQDRSETALETEKVLDDLLPLLQSLKPQDLSTTLNALSAALRGRGDRLGGTLTAAGAYFKHLNPALPTLAQDMAGLADLANNTADATPNLLRVLDNLSASSRNLVEERTALDSFLTSSTGFAATTQSIVAENEKRLVALARDSKPSLELFARYAPEFPCLLKGLAVYHPIVANTFGGLQPGLHITLEVTTDNGGYVQGQQPKYRDTRQPYCNGLPSPPTPAGDDKFDDGYRTETSDTGGLSKRSMDPAVAVVAGSVLGVPADQVPDVVTMLFGPLAEGSTVGLA